MESRFLTLAAASVAFIITVLLLDGNGLPRQLSLGIATALFLWYFARSTDIPLGPILCCIAVATVGEIVLSIGWGLYSYRHALIPFYVPPGHGLFYALTVETVRQKAVQSRAAAITRWTVIIGSVIAVASLAIRQDVWGFLWWLGAMTLIRFSKNRLMLSACFIYTTILEWTGPAIGNWRWTSEVPFLKLHCANPPAGVGILYVVLDLIVVAITSRLVSAGGAKAFENRTAVQPLA